MKISWISGPAFLFIAMAFAAISGYLVVALVINAQGPERYVSFATFWSMLYFAVGSLSGVQQEVTRGFSPQREARGISVLGALLVVAGITFGVSALLIFALPGISVPSAGPFVIGCVGYSIVAVYTGALYGKRAWKLLAVLVLSDAGIRLTLVFLVLQFSSDVALIYWATAAAFPVTALAYALLVFSKVGASSRLDVPGPIFILNSGRTILAAVAMASLVSGFPYLVAIAPNSESSESLGQFLFLLTVARSPFAVVVISLQSFVLLLFKENPRRIYRHLLVAIVAMSLGLSILLLVCQVWGEEIMGLFIHEQLYVEPVFTLSLLFAGGCLLAMFILTSISALARNLHGRYLVGWGIVALTTVVILQLPLPFSERTWLAQILPPVIGIAYFISALISSRAKID